MQYKFKFRRKTWLPFRGITVVGHRYDQSQDKMILYFPDGSVQEIANWAKCEVKLGTDWVLAQQKSMEKQAGQPIPLTVNTR